MKDEQSKPASQAAPQRKPYRAPHLVHFGDLTALTMNVSTTSKSADGPGPMSKTG